MYAHLLAPFPLVDLTDADPLDEPTVRVQYTLKRCICILHDMLRMCHASVLFERLWQHHLCVERDKNPIAEVDIWISLEIKTIDGSQMIP